jgi:hypothetical protein
MRFLETRNLMMTQLGWNRRVATLAVRLMMGIDTWDGIAACDGFDGQPLLFLDEARRIRDEFQSRTNSLVAERQPPRSP